MKWVPQVKLDHDLLVANLGGKSSQANLVLVGRNADRQLIAEFLCKPPLQVDCGLVVDGVLGLDDTEGIT